MKEIVVVQEAGKFALYVKNRNLAFLSRAGARLIKGGKFPIKDFEFLTKPEAEEAAGLLQQYLNDYENDSLTFAKQQKDYELRKKLDQWRSLSDE